MNLDFPSTASTGTIFVGQNGVRYRYDGTKWSASGSPTVTLDRLTSLGHTAVLDTEGIFRVPSHIETVNSNTSLTLTANNGIVSLSADGIDGSFSGIDIRPDGHIEFLAGDNTGYYGMTLHSTGTLVLRGDLQPETTLAHDLGSPSKQWRSLYVGTSTIYLGGNALSVSGGNLTLNGGTITAGGGSTGTSWNLTSQGNGCPINVTLTTGTFDVQVPRNHLFFRDDGSWDIGSYVNGTYITGDTSGGNGIGLTTDRGTVLFGNTPEQCVPTRSSHFHIMRDDPTTVDLFFGDDLNYVKLPYDSTLTNVGVQIGTDATNLWSFGKDGTTVFPDNTIKTTATTRITVLATTGTTGTYAWYNIFGELNNSTSSQWTLNGSVAYDSTGNVYVLGSTIDFADQNFAGSNLFLKYSPQGQLLWRKTWTDPTGDACGSYNASMRFQPMAGTATIDTIVWASNSEGNGLRVGYIGTMDLEGNLVDLQGQARAPIAIPDYRITDVLPFASEGFDGAYVSGNWYDRLGIGGNEYASIAGVDFNDVGNAVNVTFIPADQQPGTTGAHFKSINLAGAAVLATGAYPASVYNGDTKRPILGILVASTSTLTPYLFTIGDNYSIHDMWVEDSEIDGPDLYALINVYGYNNSIHSQGNNYTVLASSLLGLPVGFDRCQKKIIRAGANDGSLNTLGLGLATYGGYVYVSAYLSDISGNDSDLALLKLDAATGALVWARTIGSPSDEGVWGLYSDGYNSSSDIVIDPTGNYISFSATTRDHSTGSQYVNNFTIQYPVDGSLLGTYGDFAITDSTADFVVTDHDFTVTDITSSATISELSLTVSTATLTASATTVGEGWTNFRQTMGDTGPASTPDQTWTFDTNGNLTLPTGGQIIGLDIIGGEGTAVHADQTTEQVYISSYNTSSFTSSVWTFSNTGTLTVPGDIQDANGSVVRVATTSTAPTRVDGQLWYNTVDGRTYIKYDNTWVDTSPTVVPTPDTYLDEITIDGSTLNINGSTLTISNTGTLLVNGSEVTGSGGNEYSGPNGWQLTSSTSVVSLTSDGDLTLPEGGVISNNYGVIRLKPAGGSNSTQALLIYPTAQDGDHIHLTAGGGTTDLYLGNDDQFVKVDHSGTVVVQTYSTTTTNTWTFGTDGILTLSTASTILGSGTDPNVYIETATTSTTSTWTFGTNGILTLPAATPVIKGGGTGTDVTVIATTGTNTATWVFGASGAVTFPDATVQRSAYPTGQQTVFVNAASTTTNIDLTALTGTVIEILPEIGYTVPGETHSVYLPFQFMETNPNIPLGTRITVISRYNGTVNVGGWPGPGFPLLEYGSVDMVYYYDTEYGGNLWWVTGSFSW